MDSPRFVARTRSEPASSQKQLSLSKLQRTELITKYREGKTVKDLTKLYDVHRTTILAILQKAEAIRPPCLRKLTDQHVKEAHALYSKGFSLAKVAAHYEVDSTTIRREFRKANLPIRPRNGYAASS